MDKFKQFLTVARILENGQVSLSNFTLYILLGKIVITPGLDWAVVAGLLVSILSRVHKKQLYSKKEANKVAESNELNATLSKMTKEVEEIATKFTRIDDKVKLLDTAIKLRGKNNV